MASSILSGLRSLGPSRNRAPKSANGSWPKSTIPRVDEGIGRAASASASCVPTLPPISSTSEGGLGLGLLFLVTVGATCVPFVRSSRNGALFSRSSCFLSPAVVTPAKEAGAARTTSPVDVTTVDRWIP